MRKLMVKVSRDLTQVLYLVEGDEEIPLSHVPPNFEPYITFDVQLHGPSWFKNPELHLHPSISHMGRSGPTLKEVLGGDSD